MEEFLAREWGQRAPNLPYQEIDQALIVASLVESETALDNERPLIAGVIAQRLLKNMNLQIDPTVLYGVHKSFGLAITLKICAMRIHIILTVSVVTDGDQYAERRFHPRCLTSRVRRCFVLFCVTGGWPASFFCNL